MAAPRNVIQLAGWQRVAALWLAAVICGCLACFGNSISTVSAHLAVAAGNGTPIRPASTVTPSVAVTRRRRRRGSANHSQHDERAAASYARFSSDLQHDESNADQQRKCREAAVPNGHAILPEFEYSDAAISGTKRNRAGLNELLRDAEAGRIKVVYFHSLSRLARECVITMPLLKKLVYTWKVRVISIAEAIDTDRDGWELIAAIMSVVHEQYLKELSANVFRGQEGLVLAGLAVGDHCFGYSSQPVPGDDGATTGKQKPHKMYVIEPVEAAWVVRIFYWFVQERRTLRWIVRELNRLGAPKDHRATTPDWRHQLLSCLLSNRKYVCYWPWGDMKNVRDPFTGDIHQETRPDEESAKYTRHFPHLRVIDDATFLKAQELLEQNFLKHAQNRRTNGTLKWGERGGADGPPRHLLSGLVFCGECKKATFHVGGTNSKYLYCPNYHAGTCTCVTQLNRERAERMILDEIGRRILGSPAWKQAVFEQLLISWREQEERVPAELVAAEQQLADVEAKIKRLVDRVEAGDSDPEISQRLEERRTERRELVEMVATLRRAHELRGPEPTEEWLDEQLAQLGEKLRTDTPAAAYALRDLVGGRIDVREIRRPGRKRHYLQARFSITTSAVLSAVAPAVETDGTNVDRQVCEEIVIDFVEPNNFDEQSERAKELYDLGKTNDEIMAELKCCLSKVSRLLRHWFDTHGQKMPSNWERKLLIGREPKVLPPYKRIADKVFSQCEAKVYLQDIAEQLGFNECTVSKAMKFAYQSRGLPIPDGRSRRGRLDKQRGVKRPRPRPEAVPSDGERAVE